MTALLTADEAARLTVGLNVIVREGDRDVTHEIELDAPQDWVALTGACPWCNGSKRRELLTTNFIDCPDCVDGRKLTDFGGVKAIVVSVEPEPDGRNWRITLEVPE